MSTLKTSDDTTIADTKESEKPITHGEQLAAKILQDINFLKDRIERVKRLHTPNSSVLRTYESMLSTRLAVIDWMRDNGQIGKLAEAEKTSVSDNYFQIHNLG